MGNVVELVGKTFLQHNDIVVVTLEALEPHQNYCPYQWWPGSGFRKRIRQSPRKKFAFRIALKVQFIKTIRIRSGSAMKNCANVYSTVIVFECKTCSEKILKLIFKNRIRIQIF